MDVQILQIIVPGIIAILGALVGGAYKFGCKHTAAQKDRENTTKLNEIERQHRNELNKKDVIIADKDCELHQWQEKYFLLLRGQTPPSINSP